VRESAACVRHNNAAAVMMQLTVTVVVLTYVQDSDDNGEFDRSIYPNIEGAAWYRPEQVCHLVDDLTLYGGCYTAVV
jgi:hypothetical protein